MPIQEKNVFEKEPTQIVDRYKNRSRTRDSKELLQRARTIQKIVQRGCKQDTYKNAEWVNNLTDKIYGIQLEIDEEIELEAKKDQIHSTASMGILCKATQHIQMAWSLHHEADAYQQEDNNDCKGY